MDPAMLIPSPDQIPVHWGWLQFFLLFTFSLHILFVNVMLGTGLIALFKSFKRDKKDLLVAQEAGKKLPYIIAFTINTGVAPFLFLQVLYGQFIYTSSILMAVYWLSIVGLLLIAYYGAYLYNYMFDTGYYLRVFLIGISVCFMLIIAFFFSNNMTLMIQPEKWIRYFDNPFGTILNTSDAILFPRYLHFVIASVSIGGLFQAVLWKHKEKNGVLNANSKIKEGMNWFVYASVLQVLSGVWFLVKLPDNIRNIFMGDSFFGTTLFIVGLFAAGTTILFGFTKKVYPSVVSVLLTIIIMGLMRDLLRQAYLQPYFSTSTLKVDPQYSPLVLFVLSLIILVFALVFMLRLAQKEDKEVAI